MDAGTSETQIKQDLESTFTGYKIFQWIKNDIRDKEVYTSVEKSGYFDKNGNKKQQSELDDFEQKIMEIKDYLFESKN